MHYYPRDLHADAKTYLGLKIINTDVFAPYATKPIDFGYYLCVAWHGFRVEWHCV